MQYLATKTCVPRLDPERCLQRKRLLENVLMRGGAGKQLISIVAQAGQGKSHFASLLLAATGAACSWYQVAGEDKDPVAFISTLAATLRLHLGETSFPLLRKLLDNGEITASEPIRFAQIFAAELEACLPTNFHLVFDDIHLLEDSPASLLFLRSLIEASSNKSRFLLIARREVLPDLAVTNTLHIGTEALALNRSEIAEVCASVLQIPVSADVIQRLHRTTGGWIMGVLLAGHSLSGAAGGNDLRRLELLQQNEQSDIFTYFQQEVLSSLADELRRTLLKLSLLETIPLSLAQTLAGGIGIQQLLEQFTRQNLFVRQIDKDNGTFVFHHLFRDCLRNAAGNELPPDQHRTVYLNAADWHQSHAQPEKALDYYLQAEDYATAGTLLQQLGPGLVASNRLVTLQAALDRLPEKVLDANAWLCFFYGVTHMECDPPEAYRYLKSGSDSFAEEKDLFGELLAATHLVNFHCLIDGMLKSGGPFLERADKLYVQLAEKLNFSSRFQIVQILSLGFIYISADSIKAGRYTAIAQQLAEEAGHDNFAFGATLSEIYRYGFQGNWKRLRKAVEELTPLYCCATVSDLNKMTYRMLVLNLLAMEGDFDCYLHLKEVLLKGSIKGISEKTVFAPFLLVWDIDTYIATGRIDEAIKAVKESFELGGAANGPHMRSQYLHYQAYLFALQGKKDDSLAAAKESSQLRTVAGGEYFIALNALILGAAYVQLQMPEEAEPLLSRAIKFSTETGNGFNCAAAHAHRAYSRLTSGNQPGALDDIRQMLRSLKEQDYAHFFSWTPRIIEGLLRVAVDHGIETDYARKLASERLGKVLLPDNKTVQLLKIKTLGGLSLEIDGITRMTASQLTPGQRDILAMLIAAPEGSLSTGEVQLTLWPESSDKKARSTLDNLLSRLRRTLDETFGPQTSKNYLVLEKGILHLRYCQIDITEFQNRVQAGFKYLKGKEFWQAGNALRSAHSLWTGEFMPGVQSADSVNDLRHDLLNLYLECARQLPEILLTNGQRDEALKVAQEALRYDQTNEVLIRWIYNFHTHNSDLEKAVKSIRQYTKALTRDGYTSSEIEEILEGFWARAT